MRPVLAALLLITAQSQVAQDRAPARDRPAETGTIRGRVVAGDSGAPIGRATITLTRQETSSGRSYANRDRAVSDDQGAFQITGLPAADYGILVTPSEHSAQYLATMYGATAGPWSGLPPPIHVAAGQIFDAGAIRLPRAGVIAGRVTDTAGIPLARVQIHAFQLSPWGAPNELRRPGLLTDDLGQFRLYGLTGGEYVVYADTGASPGAMPKSGDDDAERFGFLTTFFPATGDEAAAERVRVRPGPDALVEIRMAYGRLARVSGTVTDSRGSAVTGATGYLVRAAQRVAGAGAAEFTTDDKGRFQLSNVSPGAYRLTLRRRPNVFEANPGLVEAASVPISVTGPDLDVPVVTAPGATITGRIVFDPEPDVPPAAGSVRASVTIGNPDPSCEASATASPVIGSDLTVTFHDLMCAYLVRATGPAGAALKTVTLGTGEVITDTPTRFANGDRVTILLSSRTSTIEGRVVDERGTPVAGAGVLTFGQDRSTWISAGSGVRRATSGADGRFRITGLFAGSYYILAAPGERLSALPGFGAGFFEDLSRDATLVEVGDADHRTIELKVRRIE